MTDRLILPMLDVCVACLREGVVADEDTVDGAMIFATGFAPVPRRAHALREDARRGRDPPDALAILATLW